MTNRIIVLGALFIALALSVNFVLEESEQSSPGIQRNEPDLYMLNASISQYDQQGRLQHSVNAARFTRFPLTEVTAMISPSIHFGQDDDDTKPWQVTSEEGRLLSASSFREEVVELWDQVVAARMQTDDQFFRIATESLTVYPQRHYLETDRLVTITSENARTSAAGMQAFLDEGRFIFHGTKNNRVTTEFKPATTRTQ